MDVMREIIVVPYRLSLEAREMDKETSNREKQISRPLLAAQGRQLPEQIRARRGISRALVHEQREKGEAAFVF